MHIRTAVPADFATLLDLMRGYYRDDGLEFDADTHAHAMERLLREPQWGRVWLAESDGVIVGYLALCIGFSLELGGNDAFVDEVFVLPEHRGRGVGGKLLEYAAKAARELGVTAMHLEVDRTNTAAQGLYTSLGFERRDRYFVMTLRTRP